MNMTKNLLTRTEQLGSKKVSCIQPLLNLNQNKNINFLAQNISLLAPSGLAKLSPCHKFCRSGLET